MRRALLAVAAALLATSAAGAATDADLGPDFRGAGDARLFVGVLARCHERDPGDTARLAVRCPDADELATALFVAGRTSRPPDAILALRAQGKSWWEIGGKLGLPADAWFPALRHEPGPPYNRAYAAWRRLREKQEPLSGLDDTQARDLAVVRLLGEYFGVPPETAMAWRAGGQDARLLVATEYHRRHPAGAALPAPGGRRK